MLSSMTEIEPKDGTDSNQATIISTTTWPKAHLSQRTMSDLQFRIQLERAINAAKQSMGPEIPDGQTTITVTEQQAEQYRIKRKLLDALEKVRERKNRLMLAKAQRQRPKKAPPMAQPHFGSMIISGTTLQQKEALLLSHWLHAERKRPSFRKRSLSILSDSTIRAKTEEEDEEIRKEEGIPLAEAVDEPFLIRHCPLFTTLMFAVLLIVFGSVLFQAVDAQIGAKPFQNVLTFCFQALGTIGWGDVRAGTQWGQVLCTVYTLFGVPMFFSALANVGRTLLSEFYTIDWIFLTCVVRPRRADEPIIHYHMPLLKALQWLIVHQFVGLILYGELFKHYRPVQTLYFCLTSMATIGIGDFHPDAANMIEAIGAIMFLGAGIGLLAALLIGIAYHFQTLFFILFRGWLLQKIQNGK